VVQNQEQLEARVQFVRDNYGGTVLIERFIVGRELHVSVVDLHGTGTLVPLPLGEIEFVAPGSERIWPIYSYTAKWDESSTEFKYTNIRIGNHVPEELLARLHKVADAAFRIIGCRDYARIDTRVTADGEIYVLEVNPNPSIYSILIDSGLPAVGADYDTFIHALVRNALTRGADARNTGDRRVRKPG
jgi:D-alanine-D-alanine ligase